VQFVENRVALVVPLSCIRFIPQLGFEVNEKELRQVLLRVLLFFPVTILPMEFFVERVTVEQVFFLSAFRLSLLTLFPAVAFVVRQLTFWQILSPSTTIYLLQSVSFYQCSTLIFRCHRRDVILTTDSIVL
jgi:hypothetical protein